jgi:hypothetical protein
MDKFQHNMSLRDNSRVDMLLEMVLEKLEK